MAEDLFMFVQMFVITAKVQQGALQNSMLLYLEKKKDGLSHSNELGWRWDSRGKRDSRGRHGMVVEV